MHIAYLHVIDRYAMVYVSFSCRRDDKYFVTYCRKARSIVEIFRLMHYDLWGHKQFYLKSQCASAVKAL